MADESAWLDAVLAKLKRLDGKKTINQIADEIKSLGHIGSSEAYRNYQRIQVRRAIVAFREMRP